MAIYLKKFETQAAYEAYTADTSNFIKPNVSLTVDNNTVYYNPWVETMVVAKYNVTESTKTQMILGYRQTGATSSGVTTAFTSVYVDGNEIEISDANVNYTFDTVGEHTVKYELKDPTTINMGAFNGQFMGNKSVNAVSIIIPNSVTSIGQFAFGGCSSLTSITIPSGVTSIGSGVFQGCSGLTSIDIPSGVTSIGSSAFTNCYGLTSIDIPSGVTSIGGYAFKYCGSLTSVTVEATTPPTLGTNAFSYNASGRKIYVPSASVETYKSATNWSDYASDIEPIS